MGSSPNHSQIPVYQSPQSISWPPQSGRDCAAVPRTSGMGRNLPLDPQVTMGRQAISTEGFALILQFQSASG